ncbi:MAG: hypothetical protein ACI9ND_002261 [Yoonia sp.]|jgi:uncharacterized protein YjiS (DUF1127 family)
MLSMSTYNMNSMMTNREMAIAVLALPFRAIASFLRSMASNTSRMRQLDDLQALSDAELAKRGLTRAQAALQMLRNPF